MVTQMKGHVRAWAAWHGCLQGMSQGEEQIKGSVIGKRTTFPMPPPLSSPLMVAGSQARANCAEPPQARPL